ncbi:hypothetical protein F5B21DRAFT_259621 [Xylaria acuta]|nr:hypothetical protein F5B21DRAFT_259621 [Xylaria acuta]
MGLRWLRLDPHPLHTSRAISMLRYSHSGLASRNTSCRKGWCEARRRRRPLLLTAGRGRLTICRIYQERPGFAMSGPEFRVRQAQCTTVEGTLSVTGFASTLVECIDTCSIRVGCYPHEPRASTPMAEGRATAMLRCCIAGGDKKRKPRFARDNADQSIVSAGAGWAKAQGLVLRRHDPNRRITGDDDRRRAIAVRVRGALRWGAGSYPDQQER